MGAPRGGDGFAGRAELRATDRGGDITCRFLHRLHCTLIENIRHRGETPSGCRLRHGEAVTGHAAPDFPSQTAAACAWGKGGPAACSWGGRLAWPVAGAAPMRRGGGGRGSPAQASSPPGAQERPEAERAQVMATATEERERPFGGEARRGGAGPRAERNIGNPDPS